MNNPKTRPAKKFHYECIVCSETDKSKFYTHNKSRCKIHLYQYHKELLLRNPEYAEEQRKRARDYERKKMLEDPEYNKKKWAKRKESMTEKDWQTKRNKSSNHWRNTKTYVIEMYGGKCQCCGETNQFFLTLDHIHNNGAEERRTMKQQSIYVRLKKEGKSEDYQILCMNCNFGKARNKGICPHQENKDSLVGNNK